MAHATASANWAIEVEVEVDGKPLVEYYSITQLSANGDRVRFRTTRGQELELKRDSVRKVLLVRATAGVEDT